MVLGDLSLAREHGERIGHRAADEARAEGVSFDTSTSSNNDQESRVAEIAVDHVLQQKQDASHADTSGHSGTTTLTLPGTSGTAAEPRWEADVPFASPGSRMALQAINAGIERWHVAKEKAAAGVHIPGLEVAAHLSEMIEDTYDPDDE